MKHSRLARCLFALLTVLCLSGMPVRVQAQNAKGVNYSEIQAEFRHRLVDEEGTEAAAATGVIIDAVPIKFHLPPPPPIPFKADHPFLFLVRHNATGSILFMGRVNDPRED